MAKSKEATEYNKLNLQYRETFNRTYGIAMGDGRTLLEHIEILKEALRTGTPVPYPKYDIEGEDVVI